MRPASRSASRSGASSACRATAACCNRLPSPLVHFVVQNGTYEANGSHPIPNTKVDFSAMARAAGYAHVHEFSELANFEQQAGHVLKQAGPVFATLHVERAKPLTYDYANLYDPARRAALKAALREARPK